MDPTIEVAQQIRQISIYPPGKARKAYVQSLARTYNFSVNTASPAIKASQIALLEYMNRMLKQTFLDICHAHPEIDVQDILDIPGFQNPWNHVVVSPDVDAALVESGTLKRKAAEGKEK